MFTFSSNFISGFTKIKDKISENRNPIILEESSIDWFFIISFINSYDDAASIVGRASKKENFIAISFLKFNKIPAINVIPSLDTPGNADNPCARPTRKA